VKVDRARARVLLVGIGGLGCPAALALASSGVGVIGLCDDDEVDRSNLHRQILFGESDVGTMKLDAAARFLSQKFAQSRLEGGEPRQRTARADVAAPTLRMHPTRLLPDNAVALVREYDVVLEGSDNFATKFLTADACAIAGVAVVHASAVRWVGTALAVGPVGCPCYRCLFEDVLGENAPNCAEAGILGPVAGIVAAAQVELALALIDGEAVEGHLVTFDGRTDVFRRRIISRRADCPLCGPSSSAHIDRIEPERYVSPAFAG
jgi:molybdopterin/thiamine biosynthesis adenylyltransferase